MTIRPPVTGYGRELAYAEVLGSQTGLTPTNGALLALGLSFTVGPRPVVATLNVTRVTNSLANGQVNFAIVDTATVVNGTAGTGSTTTSIVSSAALFTAAMLGAMLTSNGSQVGVISAVTDSTHATVTTLGAAPTNGQSLSITNFALRASLTQAPNAGGSDDLVIQKRWPAGTGPVSINARMVTPFGGTVGYGASGLSTEPAATLLVVEG